MKKIIVLGILLVSVLGVWVSLSADDRYYEPYTPVLVKRSVLESSIKLVDALELKEPGKIYVWKEYLFISESSMGLHVLNNTDPSSPQNIGFIQIPGNVDIAIKGNYMYADNAVDLVTIDISNIADGTVSEVDRKREVFPQLSNPDNYIPWEYDIENRPDSTVIVGWNQSENYNRNNY